MHIKKTIKNFAVRIGGCDDRSIEIWRYYLCTIWRSKFHYFRKNHTTENASVKHLKFK